MANFRRRRPRMKTSVTHTASATRRKAKGIKPVKLPKPPHWRWSTIQEKQAYSALFRWDDYPSYSRSPAVWNRVYHNKPTRARARHLARQIKDGKVDADAAFWPSHKKPTVYYW